MSRHHPLRGRLDCEAAYETLDLTLEVLAALDRIPRTGDDIASRATGQTDADTCRSVSKRLAHLVKHAAATEVICRDGEEPKHGTDEWRLWQAVEGEEAPLLIVACRMQWADKRVRRKLNEIRQSAAKSGQAPSVIRAWAITHKGLTLLREHS